MNKWLSHNVNVVALLGNLRNVLSYVRLAVSENLMSSENVSHGREIMPLTSSLPCKTGNPSFRAFAVADIRIVSTPIIL